MDRIPFSVYKLCDIFNYVLPNYQDEISNIHRKTFHFNFKNTAMYIRNNRWDCFH